MVRKYKIYWIAALSALLAACSNTPVQPPPNTGKYAPKVNPNPKYFMTVEGNIDPRLKNTVPLKIITSYYTTNSECRYVISSFEGASTYRKINSTINVKTDSTGNYKYSIPLDLYEPGYCGWNIINITYIIDNKTPDYEGYNIASFFNPKRLDPPSLIGIDNWICQNNNCDLDENTFLSGKNNLPINKNYHFKINLRKNS